MESHRGLQRERTVLAWSRTAFSIVVAGALVIREAVVGSAHLALVVLSVLAAGLLLAIVGWRVTSLKRPVGGPVAASRRVAALFVSGAVALQALAFFLVVS